MSREIGGAGPVKVAILDDSKLIYSDDYRYGWIKGFQGLGCEVKVFDIGALRNGGMQRQGPYRSNMIRGLPKMLAQDVVKWRPNVAFAHHGRAASSPGFIDYLKRYKIRTACYLCDEPYESGETLVYSPAFSAVFTMDWCTVNHHTLAREGRSGVFYLPPGVDVSHFKRRPYFDSDGLLQRKIPAFFLGNATLEPRPDWLKPTERVVDGAQVRYWKSTPKGHKDWFGYADYPGQYANCVVGLNVHRDPAINQNCYKRRVLARSRHQKIPNGLTLCKNPPATWGTGFWNDGNLPASHVNPRFLEMAACGTVVVSDNHRSELARMFPLAPQASDPAHFLELVHYYIEHPNEAEEIGHVCSSLISKQHSYQHRAAEVLIRLGLKELHEDELCTSLGAPEDWLTPQDSNVLEARSSSEATGLSERWSPASGRSWIKGSGSLKEERSLSVRTPWSV